MCRKPLTKLRHTQTFHYVPSPQSPVTSPQSPVTSPQSPAMH
ncbi:hypothetical protein [Sphaerospermopsis kisseleviana]|nr:hypothetical protein [Sphaerospermopsis kisseleviana]